MGPQPVAAPQQQLVDLVGADPVVLGVVEHRQQHVEMLQRRAHGLAAGEASPPRTGCLPRRELRVQRDGRVVDLVTERIEQPPQDLRPAPHRHDRQVNLKIEGLFNQFGPVVASAPQRRAEQPASATLNIDDAA